MSRSKASPARAHTPGPPGAAYAVFAAALVPYLTLVARFNAVGDDAYISFRYARHLAAGHGLRYNLAESPPVEGFSNFLWVLLMALPEALGLDVTVFARGVSVLCGGALLWLVVRRIRDLTDGALLPMAAGALFWATLPFVAVWSTSGLETMPFALLLFATWDLLDPVRGEPRPLAGGLAAVGTALIRSDGVFWAALALVAVALGRRGAGARTLARAAAVLAAGTAVFLLWRHAYFGGWMSNAALAKLSLSGMVLDRGLDYVVVMLLTCTSVPLVLGASVALLSGRAAAAARPVLLLAVAPLGYSVAVGGDWMAMGRFLVPGMAFCAVLAGLGTRRLRDRAGPAAAAACVAALVALSLLPAFDLHPVPHAWRQRFHFRWNVPAEDYRSEYRQWRYEREIAERWSRVGLALGELLDTSRLSYVADGIGARGYYTEFHIYDRFGLVDRELAREELPRARVSPGHDRVVPGAYFEKHRPSIIYADAIPRPTEREEVLRRVFWAVSLYWGEPVDRVRHFEPLLLELPESVRGDGDEVLLVIKRRGVEVARHPR